MNGSSAVEGLDRGVVDAPGGAGAVSGPVGSTPAAAGQGGGDVEKAAGETGFREKLDSAIGDKATHWREEVKVQGTVFTRGGPGTGQSSKHSAEVASAASTVQVNLEHNKAGIEASVTQGKRDSAMTVRREVLPVGEGLAARWGAEKPTKETTTELVSVERSVTRHSRPEVPAVMDRYRDRWGPRAELCGGQPVQHAEGLAGVPESCAGRADRGPHGGDGEAAVSVAEGRSGMSGNVPAPRD